LASASVLAGRPEYGVMALISVSAPLRVRPSTVERSTRRKTAVRIGSAALPRSYAWLVLLLFTVVGPLGSCITAYYAGSLRVGAFAAATGLYLPLFLALLWSVLRGRRPTGACWMVAAMAAVILGATPFVGSAWLPVYSALGLALLVVLRPPWSIILFAGLAATAIVLAFAFAQPLAAPLAASAVGKALAVYAVLQLVAVLRQLEDARALLAANAVAQERLRIDDELRRTVGADLTAIAAQAERLSTPGQDATNLQAQLPALVATSRRTLARVREMIAGYRRPSLEGELDTARTLLRAAGIDVVIVPPAGELSGPMRESVRAAMRSATVQLLRDGSARRGVITVSHNGGVVGVDIRADEARPGVGQASAS
jgi:two-component system, NarL family, sensor histidine kinase DesK